MSFFVPCPNCGQRDVNEFAYGGEVLHRPKSLASPQELGSYLYFRDNVAGVQCEWWYHRFGCQQWLLAHRDTRTNEVLDVQLASPSASSAARPSLSDVMPGVSAA
jgi:methylglutamate dehydrogenase subunit B